MAVGRSLALARTICPCIPSAIKHMDSLQAGVEPRAARRWWRAGSLWRGLIEPERLGFNSDIVCPCVVHRTFSGILQSDVTCQRCGWRSSTHDPFLDLSLDIRTARARTLSALHNAAEQDATLNDDGSIKKKSKKVREREEKERKERLAREGSGIDDEQSLNECLRRYCASEKLAQSDYSCAQCGVGSQAVKQLSLCRLPPVLCIQLKRFEHNTTTGTKIETRVKFPLTLDVRDYCTSALRERLDEDGSTSSPSTMAMDPDSYLYDLFTVVVHEGKLNTGHYYCYSRWRNLVSRPRLRFLIALKRPLIHTKWYIANDDSVRPAKLQDVLLCRAYQLCYMRRSLQNVRQSPPSS
ncbi:hypothetical protein L7F22_050415 [Adiantum nelumboides]|nr:hypothetical protein [Adiantum nelumboides]